jgi:hypothetical protein
MLLFCVVNALEEAPSLFPPTRTLGLTGEAILLYPSHENHGRDTW